MKNEWYEIAVSYTDDGGTESIESKDTLEEALKFANSTDRIKDDDVGFIFIDKWYDADVLSEYGGDARIDDDFKVIYIDKETKQ